MSASLGASFFGFNSFVAYATFSLTGTAASLLLSRPEDVLSFLFCRRNSTSFFSRAAVIRWVASNLRPISSGLWDWDSACTICSSFAVSTLSAPPSDRSSSCAGEFRIRRAHSWSPSSGTVLSHIASSSIATCIAAWCTASRRTSALFLCSSVASAKYIFTSSVWRFFAAAPFGTGIRGVFIFTCCVAALR